MEEEHSTVITDEEPIGRKRHAITAKSAFFFVSERYESLDYTPITNRLELEKQKTLSFGSLMIEDSLRILLFVIAGILTSFLGVFLEFSIHKIGHLKYRWFNNYIIQHLEDKPYELLTVTVFRFAGVLIPIMIGTALVVYIAPYASGGGVAQCIAYLNGIRVPKILSIRGLIVKAFSTICMCVSGLAGGKEGPAIHIGTITGGSLPSILPRHQFWSDRERRDLAAAGFGAGLTVVFGAPVGGMLLALEEGISFWDIALMWKMYLCCIVAYGVSSITTCVLLGVELKMHNPELTSLGEIPHTITQYELFEICLFALLAVFGGLLGAIIVQTHKYVYLFKKKYITTNTRRMLLSFVASCILTICQFGSIRGLRNCSKLTDTEIEKLGNNTVTKRVHQLYCAEDEHSDMSLLFQQTQPEIIRAFFGTEILQMSSLIVFGIIYFLLMCITMGLSISYGVFIPQILLGASWGRLFGTFLNHHWPEARWAVPAKYAYIGAVAQLSATVGKTFSILVIMVEASNSISFSFPLMMVVIITKVVSNFFTPPIYQTQMLLQGLPFLYTKPPPLSLDQTTKSIMSTSLTTFPLTPTVGTIINVLKTTKHHGYPIAGYNKQNDHPVRLLGLILRQQLLILLKHKAYELPPPTTTQEICESLDIYLKYARKRLNDQEILDSVDPNYYNTKIDLSPYYDIFPQTVFDMTPAIKSYSLFRNMALRHLVVLQDTSSKPIGMITRKDLAKFHTFENFFRLGVTEMLVKS